MNRCYTQRLWLDNTASIGHTSPLHQALEGEKKELKEEALAAVAGGDFTLPETIFNNVPSLKAILKKYTSGEIASLDGVRKAIRNDVWFMQNEGPIRNRYVQLYNYQELVKTGRAQGTTRY